MCGDDSPLLGPTHDVKALVVVSHLDRPATEGALRHHHGIDGTPVHFVGVMGVLGHLLVGSNQADRDYQCQRHDDGRTHGEHLVGFQFPKALVESDLQRSGSASRCLGRHLQLAPHSLLISQVQRPRIPVVDLLGESLAYLLTGLVDLALNPQADFTSMRHRPLGDSPRLGP